MGRADYANPLHCVLLSACKQSHTYLIWHKHHMEVYWVAAIAWVLRKQEFKREAETYTHLIRHQDHMPNEFAPSLDVQ